MPLREALDRTATIVLALVVALGVAGCPSEGSGSCTATSCPTGQACISGACRVANDGSANTDASLDSTDDIGADTAARDILPIDTGPPMGQGCSGDLRDVLDNDGHVLLTCPPEQGCRMGMCVPACDAASASRGTVACSFQVSTPPAYPPALPPCLAVFVANTWPRPARVTVRRGTTTFDVSTFGRIVDNARPAAMWAPVPAAGIPENQVAVLFLSSDPNAVMPENGVPLTCPVTPAVNMSTMLAGSGVTNAFVMTSDVPVSAYDILPYGGARSHFPSAELVLPTSAWRNGYVVISPPPGTFSPPGPQWLQVMAAEADTLVRVRPTVDLPGNARAPAIARGATGMLMLNAGEYVQWQLPGGLADPSGTLVASDHPVGVVSGTRFIRLQPMPAPGGEAAHQQNLPIDALSNLYVAAPYETRRADLAPEPVPYRIVGAVDGTRLTFDPPIAGAPATIDRGTLVEVTSAQPFIVSSQDPMHPFAFAQMMTTANLVGGSRPGAIAPGFGPQLGDEEFVIVFPPAQFLSRYVVFSDPAYPTTNLVVVRVRGATGFAPVMLDCVGALTGFRPVGSSGQFEMTTVDLVRANVPNGTCGNGRHSAQSAAPFGVVVWGLDSYSSYAYPAGGNASTLSPIPPPL